MPDERPDGLLDRMERLAKEREDRRRSKKGKKDDALDLDRIR